VAPDRPDRPFALERISGGCQITNIGKYSEAKDLAIVLQTGALPLAFKQVKAFGR